MILTNKNRLMKYYLINNGGKREVTSSAASVTIPCCRHISHVSDLTLRLFPPPFLLGDKLLQSGPHPFFLHFLPDPDLGVPGPLAPPMPPTCICGPVNPRTPFTPQRLSREGCEGGGWAAGQWGRQLPCAESQQKPALTAEALHTKPSFSPLEALTACPSAVPRTHSGRRARGRGPTLM